LRELGVPEVTAELAVIEATVAPAVRVVLAPMAKLVSLAVLWMGSVVQRPASAELAVLVAR
jgi:hypothetical protein